MLLTKRKQLTKSIVVKVIIAILLIIANVFIGLKISIKVAEKQIYNAIVCEYSNLIYDKELSKIAEECAEKCYFENLDISNIKMLENDKFVRLYSTKSHVAKYTLKCNSNDEFIENFFLAMKTKEHSATNSCLKESDYIGVGKYKNQIFILACYND